MFLRKTALPMEKYNIAICDAAQLHVIFPPAMNDQVHQHKLCGMTHPQVYPTFVTTAKHARLQKADALSAFAASCFITLSAVCCEAVTLMVY